MNGKTRTRDLTTTRTTPTPPSVLQVGVSAIMRRQVPCVRDDLAVEPLRTLLLDEGLGGVPVVNRHGKLVGFVSMTDLVRERFQAGDTVNEIMVRTVVTLPESATLAQAAAVMAFEGVHQIPILNGDGSIAGIVSATDILRHLARAEGYLLPAYTQLQRKGARHASRC